MGKSASTPDAPDPQVTIPLQTAANKDTFDYMLGQQRVRSNTPGGTQYWTKTGGDTYFDQTGYEAAMAEYQKGLAAPQKTWNNRTGTWDGGGGGLMGSGGSSGPVPQAPTREQFTTAPGTPEWTYNEVLSPDQQKLYDANVQSQIGQAGLLNAGTNRVAGALNSPYSQSGIPGLDMSIDQTDNYGSGDYARGLAARSLGDNFNNTVADATYGQQTRYLDPQIQQQNQALEARLGEQGFVPGTPGYQQAMQNFMDTRNRAYGQARDSAITAGYQQGNTQLGQQTAIAGLLGNMRNSDVTRQIGAAGFENQSIGQEIARQLQLRNQPLNELNALRTGTQVAGPSAQAQYTTPQMPNVDVLGAYNTQYQGQLADANAQNASNNGLMGNLAGLGMAYMTGGLSLGAQAGLAGAGAGLGAGMGSILPSNGYALSPMVTR